MNDNIFEKIYLNLIFEENKFEEKIVKNIEIKDKSDEFKKFLDSIHIDGVIQENKGKSLKLALKDIGSKLKGIENTSQNNTQNKSKKNNNSNESKDKANSESKDKENENHPTEVTMNQQDQNQQSA